MQSSFDPVTYAHSLKKKLSSLGFLKRNVKGSWMYLSLPDSVPVKIKVAQIPTGRSSASTPVMSARTGGY